MKLGQGKVTVEGKGIWRIAMVCKTTLQCIHIESVFLFIDGVLLFG